MPIVDIELVADDPDAGRGPPLQALADELGDLFGSGPGGTWVKLRATDPAGYAENQTVGGAFAPVFVNIVKHQLPDENERRREVAAVAEIVARTLDRPRENVHVLYAPSAEGRIGFGGELA